MVAKRRWLTAGYSNLSNYAFSWFRYSPVWALFRITFRNIITRTGNMRKLRTDVALGCLWWHYCQPCWLSHSFLAVCWPRTSLSWRISRNRKARSFRTSQIRRGKKAKGAAWTSQVESIGSWRIIIIKRGGRRVFRLRTECRLAIREGRNFKSRGCRRWYRSPITWMDWRELVDLCSYWHGSCFHLYLSLLHA